jgi:multisubunit Na+/H+ antiporter MnhB subunit
LTLLFAVTAIWLGVIANRRARRSGTARPRGAISGIVLGGFGLAFSALWLLVLAVFWPQLTAYYNCMSGANTVAAQQVCRTHLNNSVGSEISVLQNGR